jgi:hypothetical protein
MENVKKVFWILVITVTVCGMSISGNLFAEADQPMQAGVAAAVSGEVKATTPPSKDSRILKSGDQVFMGDKIETGTDGQLQILLLDQTVFTLGPSSGITVDEFVYDPSNDDGKVKASMMKGIFRVVSGKVAHKKPENMSVELPAGSIGFRGTNVAGIIDGQKSLIVLLGPVGAGRIYVTNIVNGEVIGVDIDDAGNATIVDGPNSAPVPVFQVSEADLARIAQALQQKMSGDSVSVSESGAAAGAGAASGTVNAQDLLNILNDVDAMNQQSILGAQNAANVSGQQADRKDSGSGGSSGSGYSTIGG